MEASRDQLIKLSTEALLRERSPMRTTKLPTQAAVQRYLREKHDIKMFVEPFITGYRWRIYYDNMSEGLHGYTNYQTWEAAMEAGIIESLELLK